MGVQFGNTQWGLPGGAPATQNQGVPAAGFQMPEVGVNTDSFGLTSFGLGENVSNGASAGGFLGGTPPPPGADGGFDWGSMQGWGQMLGGIGDIGQAYMAYKNYGLAKDQFKFGKQAFNRNLANEAVTTNEALTHKSIIQNSGRPVAQVDGRAINV